MYILNAYMQVHSSIALCLMYSITYRIRAGEVEMIGCGTSGLVRRNHTWHNAPLPTTGLCTREYVYHPGMVPSSYVHQVITYIHQLNMESRSSGRPTRLRLLCMLLRVAGKCRWTLGS